MASIYANLLELKESVCIRKEYNSRRIGLGHQHRRRFIVLRHQHGRRDVMWKHSIVRWESVARRSCARIWKLSSRLFSRPDWLPLGLRGWAGNKKIDGIVLRDLSEAVYFQDLLETFTSKSNSLSLSCQNLQWVFWTASKTSLINAFSSLFETCWLNNFKKKQPTGVHSHYVDPRRGSRFPAAIAEWFDLVYVWIRHPPLQAKKITRLCSFRFLKEILERLKQECHWLRRVSLRLCAQCKLCLKTKNCLWHKEQKCSHEDCTHYVDINDKPFVCVNDLSSNSAIPQTWIQVSGQNRTGKFSYGNCSMFVTIFNKLI